MSKAYQNYYDVTRKSDKETIYDAYCYFRNRFEAYEQEPHHKLASAILEVIEESRMKE